VRLIKETDPNASDEERENVAATQLRCIRVYFHLVDIKHSHNHITNTHTLTLLLLSIINGINFFLLDGRIITRSDKE
jgi:hypothetical protein